MTRAPFQIDLSLTDAIGRLTSWQFSNRLLALIVPRSVNRPNRHIRSNSITFHVALSTIKNQPLSGINQQCSTFQASLSARDTLKDKYRVGTIRDQLLQGIDIRDVTVRRLTVDGDGAVIAENRLQKLLTGKPSYCIIYWDYIYVTEHFTLRCCYSTIPLYCYTRARLTGYGTVRLMGHG